MKVSRIERDELVQFLSEMAVDVKDIKQIAKCALFVSMLEKHQGHTADVKIIHKGLKGLKDFITEVRACES